MADDRLRILVVDDSALYRQLVRNVLRDVPEVEVVGMAGSGQEALDQIDRLAPDLITLDVNMPGLNGIEVLRALKRRRSAVKAVMLSGLTAEGTQVTTDSPHLPAASEAPLCGQWLSIANQFCSRRNTLISRPST